MASTHSLYTQIKGVLRMAIRITSQSPIQLGLNDLIESLIFATSDAASMLVELVCPA
jgi:hypothetical protein